MLSLRQERMEIQTQGLITSADPIDPVHITMVRLKDKEFIRVHGDHRKVTAKLTRTP